MFKRILSLVIVLCLIATVPVSASDYGFEEEEGITVTNEYITYLILDDFAKVVECVSDAPYAKIAPMVYGKPVTEIGEGAFSHCRDLADVQIPDSVTKIGCYAFDFCESLTTIEIPDSVTEIGERAFYMCEGLNEINISQYVTSLGEWMLEGCLSLYEINVDKNNPFYCSVDGVLFTKDKRTLIKYPAAKSLSQYKVPDSVRKLEEASFRNAWKINEIIIPKYVTEIGDFAFFGCEGLIDIELPLNITKIGSMTFSYCYNLKKVVIPYNVTEIGSDAFANCENLEEIEIPPTIRKIGNTVFSECQCLKSVDIPEGVTKIESGTFWECSALESVFLPSTLKSIGGSAFYSTSKLERIYYGGTETTWNEIQIDNYYNNFVHSAEKYYNMVIDYGEVGEGGETGSEPAYPEYINPIIWGDEVIISTCEDREFTELEIPSQINGKNVTKILAGAFAEKADINRLILPATIVSVGNAAFEGTDINKAYFRGTHKQFDGIMFGEGNEELKNMVKIIPNGTTETTVSDDKTSFEVDFVCVENEKTVLVALYNNGLFVGTQIGTYKGEKLIFTTDKEYTEAKVMLWDNLSNMKALADNESFV